MNRKIICKADLIEQTLILLKEAGRGNKELVVLWLAKQDHDTLEISEVYLPDQIGGRDIFRIPPNGMNSLMKHLKERKLMVAAQVHSHPMEAFHSLADDKWAIIRHVGALSLVLPFFALQTQTSNFLSEAAIFIFTQQGMWDQVKSKDIQKILEIR